MLPKNWPVVQTFTMIDASTFEMYLSNMRSIMMELVKLSDVVIFNRCTKDTKKGSLRRAVKAANRQVQIIYESIDGSDEDDDEDDLPFDLTADTIEANARFFKSADEVPRQAVSMGIGNIMAAKCVVLVATGENKAKAVRDTIRGPITPRVPASVLQLHPCCVILTDREAGKLMLEE